MEGVTPTSSVPTSSTTSTFSGYNPGLFTRVAFVTCGGTPAPVAGDFGCTILEATDQLGANVTATCTVTLPNS